MFVFLITILIFIIAVLVDMNVPLSELLCELLREGVLKVCPTLWSQLELLVSENARVQHFLHGRAIHIDSNKDQLLLSVAEGRCPHALQVVFNLFDLITIRGPLFLGYSCEPKIEGPEFPKGARLLELEGHEVPTGDPQGALGSNASLEDVISVSLIVQRLKEVMNSFGMERSLSAVYPALDSILLCLRSVSRLLKLLHPASRLLRLFKIK